MKTIAREIPYCNSHHWRQTEKVVYFFIMSEIKIPTRSEIPEQDTWDLSQLFKSDDEWEQELAKIEPLSLEIESFKGKIGDSAESLLAAITKLSQMEQVSELVGHYPFLLSAGDAGHRDAATPRGGMRGTAPTKRRRAATSWRPPLPMPA